LRHQNHTGRNDFAIAKAAYDDAHVFFFVQTLNRMTPHTDPHWMLLFLDTDQRAKTGWLGYEYVINLEVLSDSETTVKTWRNGTWTTVGHARYRVNGNAMELAVSRPLLAQAARSPAFDFHWGGQPAAVG
jgi:hypothetical protein